ncbi:MAG: aconitate hydratase AcnA, partial [Casimicrobiaceae bacterium]
MTKNQFGTLKELRLQSGTGGQYHSLPALEEAGIGTVSRLPRSIRVVLESVLRNCDGIKVTEQHVRQVANWVPAADRVDEIPFIVARVVLQDFTGVPLLADLAAMRSAAAALGRDAKLIEPLVPVDLVIDHSVMVDYYGSPEALDLNMRLEFKRNAERYQFMKWGMQAFDTFRVVPPGVGIVHQVNLEYLARGVHRRDGVWFPDSLVGTDSHTTMINGIGVVGWGVGGIEAEAAMLGQPVYILTPDVVGVEMKGRLPEGATATDLVLTVTEMLRSEKVVGKFVEFFGEGAGSLSVPDRATIGNMSPEYGATIGYFPVDGATIDYLRSTGRTDAEIEAFETYYKAQQMFGMPRAGEIDYSKTLTFDLATVTPSVAGPKRPQDRIELPALGSRFAELYSEPVSQNGFGQPAAKLGERVTTAPTRAGRGEIDDASLDLGHDGPARDRVEISLNRPTPSHVTPPAARPIEIGNGDVLIAAITSCTNTSNPSVLLAAGLLAKKAVEKGLGVRQHVKTSLAPGSRVVTDYLTRTGLLPYLEKLGFNVAAYGCTTCIG